MKTKLLFWIIFFLSSWNAAFSQEYHPFLNHSAWTVGYSTPCCVGPYSKTIYEGIDVTIGDHTYTRFLDPSHHLSPNSTAIDTVYVREDVVARKVYRYSEGTETLLYDFSLSLGETVEWGDATWTVITVDEAAVEGGTRKRIVIRKPSGGPYPFYQRWIEGVGSKALPFEPDINCDGEAFAAGSHPSHYTICSFQNGNHIYGGSSCPAVLDLREDGLPDTGITLFPNPFSRELTIHSGKGFTDATFRLYNIQGQLVKEVTHLNGQDVILERGPLQAGVYFSKIAERSEETHTSKIIVN